MNPMDRIDPQTLRAAVDGARDAGIHQDPRRLLSWAHELLGRRLMMSTAFGKSGMAILHMVKDLVPELPVYFLDTGFHFKETLEYAQKLKEKWRVNLIFKRPKLFGVEFVKKFGEKLHDRDPDLCCHKNKVEPFRDLFGPDGLHQGWITGVRRDQSSTRAEAEPIEVLEGGLVKIQPLSHWTREMVETYIREHDIDIHPLFAQGYSSIGCQPCTQPCNDPANERAGRWGGKKVECGIQTQWKKAEKKGVPPPAQAG